MGKILESGSLYFYEEDIHKVLVKEGIEPEEVYDQTSPGPPHNQATPNFPNGPQAQNMGKDDDDEDI